MFEAVLSEEFMATTLPEVQSPNAASVSPYYMEQLEDLAQKHGWTMDQTIRMALKITDIVLESSDEPDSKVYVYRGGKRYSLEITQ